MGGVVVGGKERSWGRWKTEGRGELSSVRENRVEPRQG